MNLNTQFKIKNNPLLQKYIRENSYWYKYLNRNPNLLTEMEKKMKEKYKLTTSDKINNISEKLDLIRTFMNVMK